MMKVPPMMVTLRTPWNILVDEVASCGSVGWLADFCGRRQVMNVSTLCRNPIFGEGIGPKLFSYKLLDRGDRNQLKAQRICPW